MAFTYFFRDLHVLELMVENILPDIYGRSRIKIWDAGCAMGPEPYSIAILFAECMGKFQYRNLHITASDIDEGGNFDTIIRNGVYHEEPLRRIPDNLFRKYFIPADIPGHFVLIEQIRERVTYVKHDLLSFQPLGNEFSLIICKNVLLHFQHTQRIEVIKMFYNALSPGGYFVTEQTQKMPDEVSHLFIKKVPDGQLFQKVG